jgi:phosphate transport system permease protein
MAIRQEAYEVRTAELHATIQSSYRRRKLWDALVRGCLVTAAACALVPLFSVLGYALLKGVPGLNLSFFTNLPAPVGETGGGMANSLLGTIVLVCLASFVGILWGGATGIYLSEYGDTRLGGLIRFGTDMLASVPSIVIGLFVYAFLVRPLGGFSALAGGVALGIIMIPIVARTTEELLRLVPTHLREAGLALGLPRWKVILRIVLRGCLSGIVTGIMLAVARVAGETAPLLFTALNNRFWSTSLLQPIASLPVQIYTYAIAPFEDWHTQAWAGALVLVFLVFAINLTTRFILRRDGAGRE